MKKKIKGTNGYIRYRKTVQSIYTAAILLLSVGLFLAGYLTTHTTKNILTVISVLGALPAAKSLTNLILFLPYRSFSETSYQTILEHAGDSMNVYSDLVFTSTKTVMHLDALAVSGSELIGYAEKDAKTGDIVQYFTESMKKQGVSVHMHVFHSISEMTSRLDGFRNQDETPLEEISEFINTILV